MPSLNQPVKESVKALADEISAEMGADILLINGGIEGGIDRAMIKQVIDRKRHKDVLLILTTEGGDANAGFRMARCLQCACRPPSASPALPAASASVRFVGID